MGNKQKAWFDFMFCCNYFGSENLSSPFIGTAISPQFFQKKTGSIYGLSYTANKSSWMTAHLFLEWLKYFNDFVGRALGRLALLLIESFLAHNPPTWYLAKPSQTVNLLSGTKFQLQTPISLCWHHWSNDFALSNKADELCHLSCLNCKKWSIQGRHIDINTVTTCCLGLQHQQDNLQQL